MRLLLCLFFLSAYCVADPFYPKESEESMQETFAKNSENLPRCKPSYNVENIYLPLDFSQLNLVGIIQLNEQYKALFTDKGNKIVDLKENDFIVSMGMQVEKIDMRNVIMIDWFKSQHCHQPNKIQLKL